MAGCSDGTAAPPSVPPSLSVFPTAVIGVGEESWTVAVAGTQALRVQGLRGVADLGADGVRALGAYADDVRTGAFPADGESYHLSSAEADALGLYGSAARSA